MKASVLQFFGLQRKIFGVCPRSRQFFRLSDCKLFKRTGPAHDWMDKLDAESDRLGEAEERLDAQEEALRMAARERGRRLAQAVARKLDHVFAPKKLHPDDAKVIFHPVDYLVFRGMNSGKAIKEVALLDRVDADSDHRQIQRSIEKTVERGNYDWLTLRVKDDGSITEE